MSGKVCVGGDGNKQNSSTSRPGNVRYVTYVLMHLPPEQLKNRTFNIAFSERLFKAIPLGAHLVENFPWLRHFPGR